MALHKLLSGISLILILQFKGFKAQLTVCGKASLNNNRIVGGNDARNGSWPWQASMHYSGFGHFCGGSLINKEYVLTAAHCTGFHLSRVTVYLGRQNQEGTNPNEVNRTVTQVIVHPNYYLLSPFDSDIALLKLSSPITFTPYIRPVCLAAANSTFYTGTHTWVTGWGDVNYTVPLPSPQHLQDVEVPIVGNKQCGCSYEKYVDITENMICAGAGGSGACQGDSGGALVSYQLINVTNTTDDYWVQSGVVSFGIGCAWPDFPAVYTRVSHFQNWINSYINVTTDQPGFVTITSTGNHTDEDFVCPTSPPPIPTSPPTPPTPLFTTPPTPPTPLFTTPPTQLITTPPCESGGPNVVHFSYFTHFLTLVLILYSPHYMA